MFTIFILLIVLVVFNCFKKTELSFLNKGRSDILKALFPWMIMIHHVSFATSATNKAFSDFWNIGPYVVGIFLFMSGYGLEYKYESGRINLHSFYKRLSKLLIPLIPPLTVYCCITLPFIKTDLISFFVGHFSWLDLVLPYSWFVTVILLLYLAFFTTRNKFSRNVVFDSILFIAIVIMDLLLLKVGRSGTCVESNFAFLLGVIYRQREEALMQIRKTRILLLSILLMMIVTGVYWKGLPFPGFSLIGVTIYMVPFFILFSTIKVPTSNYVVSFFKKISYELYLSQAITFGVMNFMKINNAILFVVIFFILNFTKLSQVNIHSSCGIDFKHSI